MDDVVLENGATVKRWSPMTKEGLPGAKRSTIALPTFAIAACESSESLE